MNVSGPLPRVSKQQKQQQHSAKAKAAKAKLELQVVLDERAKAKATLKSSTSYQQKQHNLVGHKQHQKSMAKLNLGCGNILLPGYINVDKYGSPDILKDLEELPWGWDDNSIEEILMIHVLEHLGQSTDIYFGIWKELYRICKNNALITIRVPHHRHEFFYDDPTHVRAVTPLSLKLFSKKNNKRWIKAGAANSPLGIHLNIDFELIKTEITPSQDWFILHPEEREGLNLERLIQESKTHS